MKHQLLSACLLSLCFWTNTQAQNLGIWAPLSTNQCVANGLREMSAELQNIPRGVDKNYACLNTPRNVMGINFARPDQCSGSRGAWNVPDTSCLLAPPAPPVPGGTGSLTTAEPFEGFADIHVHQMGNLGFSGSIVWGGAFGDPSQVLGPIPPEYKHGHDNVELPLHGSTIVSYAKTLINTIVDIFGHGEEGHPSFDSWPSHSLRSHQQAYEDWLFRAYQGGLRLMVMLAVNSEDMFGRGENRVPFPLNRITFQKARMPGRSGNDMEAVEWQVRAAYEMQAAIDMKYGKGNGWYRIVRNPEEAGKVIAGGRLAVILGTEIHHLFNCDIDRPQCTEQTVVDGLNRLEAMGVNYVFPVHHKWNQFGGPMVFAEINSGPTERCADMTLPCSSEGLSELGRFFVKELMERGMLIDTEHLSRRAFNDTMDIAEERRYPVLASHLVPFDLQTRNLQQSERARTADEIRRIFAVNGIVAPILGTASREYSKDRTSPVRVPIACAAKDGSSDQWANAYLYIRDLAPNGGVSGTSGRIAIGSDWNGFASWPGPRFAEDDSCHSRQARNGRDIPMENRVFYPIVLPTQLVPAAIDPVTKLPMFDWPAGVRQWDYNKVGFANIGMTPDFIESLRMLGLTLAELEPLYRSARGVVNLWSSARNAMVSGDRHHLRWAPQSPFDVLDFNFWDEQRDVVARGGYPLCRSREGHKLGFLRDNRCELVEQTDARAVAPLPATEISAYHAGRCLSVKDASMKDGATVQQLSCKDGSNQKWQVRPKSTDLIEIVNSNSGKCLSISGTSHAIQTTCDGSQRQTWKYERHGNTFRLMAMPGMLCLEVEDQSRKEGAAIKQAACSGASHQMWSIESLRLDDYERLYQADLGKQMWLPAQTADYPRPITVDGSRVICRSTDPEQWIGTVVGTECSGKTYEGATLTTLQFQQLFEAP